MLADVSPERARGGRRAARRGRPLRAPSASTPPTAATLVELIDRVRAGRGAERLRPALQRADLRRRVRRARHLPGHGDDALAPPSRSAPTSCPARCSASTSSRATSSGSRPGCSRSWASASSPGLSDVFARYAADELFSSVDEVGVRDGADLVVEGYDFAPTFSIWTTIEECLNPPLIWERERGFYTTAPFSEPEVFDVPRGHRHGRVRQRRARGGRADPALGRTASASRSSTGSARSSSTCCARCTSSAWTRPSRCRCAARRSRRATSSRPRCPTRRRSASA